MPWRIECHLSQERPEQHSEGGTSGRASGLAGAMERRAGPQGDGKGPRPLASKVARPHRKQAGTPRPPMETETHTRNKLEKQARSTRQKARKRPEKRFLNKFT